MKDDREPFWFKSSYSGSEGDSCVEVAVTAGAVGVRDSKDVGLRALRLTADAWSAFVAAEATR